MQKPVRHVNHLWRKAPLAPLQFPTAGFDAVSKDYILKEEQFGEFKTGKYYPVNINKIFNSKYQIVGKVLSALPPQCG